VVEEPVEGGYLGYRTIDVERDRISSPKMRVYRFTTAEESGAAALVLTKESEDGQKVLLPDDEAPRIYREYPLGGSGFVPINFVFDGKFDPSQERIKLLMSNEDKDLLEDAFAAGRVGAKHALSEGWKDAYLLVRASKPKTAFDPTNEKEKTWWTKQLASFAQNLAALPIVDCTSQLLPATSPGSPCANFVVPRLLPSSIMDETTVERLWPLVEACTGLMPPRRELAVDWTGIADGWHSLGLNISRITVSDLAKRVRGDASKLDALNLKSNKTEWLAKFLDIVGECWNKPCLSG
jgi:hypothetical protein